MAVGSLKAFLEEALENATTYQKEEMAIEIHLSITEFSVVVTKQFERGPPASRIQKASQGVAISIRQANEQVQKQALLSRQVTLALDTTGDSDEAVVPCLSLPRPSDRSGQEQQHYQQGHFEDAASENIESEPKRTPRPHKLLLIQQGPPFGLFNVAGLIQSKNFSIAKVDEWTFESDVLGSLIEHHLVKRESDNLHLSVHRLVQFEFIGYLTPPKLQEAFGAAATLLYHAFPKQDLEDAMQSRWSLCTAYSPHVLSIMRVFQRSRASTGQKSSGQVIHRLHPTAHLLRVLIHCSW
ncbi:hypothetical protein B0T24DRAFT_600307 [Lasiosphaeria ovina]|uniref:Uncharacterized protein n=1 Tax=Lasiosphaeria ovina TaxID=92902 RepID=A0AAE0JRV0_9PEZI|nr:hypothetical protein B0T24DRAFT_600307 [Lasiosphaeria ovina]